MSLANLKPLNLVGIKPIDEYLIWKIVYIQVLKLFSITCPRRQPGNFAVKAAALFSPPKIERSVMGMPEPLPASDAGRLH